MPPTTSRNLKQRIAAVVADGGGRFVTRSAARANATTVVSSRERQQKGTSSPESSSSSSSHHPPIVLAIDLLLYPTSAGLLMHGPGLRVKWHFEESWSRYVESLIGAAVEGSFLLYLGTLAYVMGRYLHGSSSLRRFEQHRGSSSLATSLLRITSPILSLLVTARYVSFVLSAILGDAAYRATSHNVSPTSDVPLTWAGSIANAYGAVADDHRDGYAGAFWSLIFATVCLACGVWTFVCFLGKHRLLSDVRQRWHYGLLWNRRRRVTSVDHSRDNVDRGNVSNGNNGAFSSDSTAAVRGGAGAQAAAAATPTMEDVESRTAFKLLPNSIAVMSLCLSCVVLGCAACELNSMGWYAPVVFAYFSIFHSGHRDDMMMRTTAMMDVDNVNVALPKLSLAAMVQQPTDRFDGASVADTGGMPSMGYGAGQQLSLAHDYQQKQMGFFPCDDVLLYLSDPTSPVSEQFNGFFGAAMLATFADRALVVVDAIAPETMCPSTVGGELFPPLGLTETVDIPDWLTRKCEVPCRSTHGINDWHNMLGRIRQSGGLRGRQPENVTPPLPLEGALEHVVCPGDDGRNTKVSVVGSNDAHEYFDRHGGDDAMMRGIPPQQAIEWAMRLGASPGEARVFQNLRGQAVWDYASALMVRNGILRLTPVVERDANEYIQNEMDAGTNLRKIYDAIEVKRGPSVLEDAEAREYAESYWASPEAREYIQHYWLRLGEGGRKRAPHDYVPLREYLRYIRVGRCDDDVHRVYVATNDPVGVMKDIEGLGPQTKGGNGIVHIDECHRVRFTVNAMSRNKEVEDGEPFAECSERYANNIANIADFLVLRGARTFAGTFYSDWGKLVRNFRLNDQEGQVVERVDGDVAEKQSDPLLLKNMEVAWGRPQPGPP